MVTAQPHTGNEPIPAVAGPSRVRRIGAAARRAAAPPLRNFLPRRGRLELQAPVAGTIGQEDFSADDPLMGRRIPAGEPIDERKEGGWRQAERQALAGRRAEAARDPGGRVGIKFQTNKRFALHELPRFTFFRVARSGARASISG